MTKRNVPVYNGTLRNHSIRLPHSKFTLFTIK